VTDTDVTQIVDTEGNLVTIPDSGDLTDVFALHIAAIDPHSVYETSTEAAAKVSAHAAAADPHTGYQTRTEKGAANGYASLGSGILVPIAQLPVGTGASQVAAGNHTHGSSGLAVSKVGKDAIGASFMALVSQQVYMKRFVLAVPALLVSVEAYLRSDGTDALDMFYANLWQEISATVTRLRSFQSQNVGPIGPGIYTSTGVVARWVALPWAPVYLPAGTYHMGIVTNGNVPHAQIAYDTGGSDGYQTSGIADRVTALTATTNDLSIRGVVLA
jgi:hypothetical protein